MCRCGARAAGHGRSSTHHQVDGLVRVEDGRQGLAAVAAVHAKGRAHGVVKHRRAGVQACSKRERRRKVGG